VYRERTHNTFKLLFLWSRREHDVVCLQSQNVMHDISINVLYICIS
jgi:hypothetical protein